MVWDSRSTWFVILIVLAAAGLAAAAALGAREAEEKAAPVLGGPTPAPTGPSVKCPIATAADLARYVTGHPEAVQVKGSGAASAVGAVFNNQCVMGCEQALAMLGTRPHPPVADPEAATEAEAASACALAASLAAYGQNAEDTGGAEDGPGVTNFYLGLAACLQAAFAC